MCDNGTFAERGYDIKSCQLADRNSLHKADGIVVLGDIEFLRGQDTT